MNKILHVTNAYPTKTHNLFGIFIKDQLEGLKNLGLDFDLFFINAKENGRIEYLRSYLKLKKNIHKYDLIHCHHFLSAYIVLKCNPPGKVLVSFLSDGPNEFMLPDNFLYRFLKRKMYSFIIKKSDARIFKTPIPSFLINDKLSFYVPNGVDTDVFYPVEKEIAKKKLGLDISKKYILFVSSQSLDRPEKRYDLFHKTVNLLKNAIFEIEELPISNVDRKTLPLYYCASEIHLLTSDFEGSPNSVKESLACNTPVVSTNVGSVSDILNGVNNCYVVNNNSPEILSKYCKIVLHDELKGFLPNYIIKKKLDTTSSLKRIRDIYKLMTN